MNQLLMTIFIGLIVVFALFISLVISDRTMAQAQNTTLPENTNNTRQILNLKDHTITLVNMTTNETISVKNYTGSETNLTTNETLSDKFSAISK